MKQERSKIKSDILLRVRLLYVLFILAGLTVFARLVWVQLFSAEVAYNADRLACSCPSGPTPPTGSPAASSPKRPSRPSGAASSRATGRRWRPRSSATRRPSTSLRPASIRSRPSANRATRSPSCSPPSSRTNPPRNTPAASARSTPAATGWSTAATPPTCAPKGGCRA